MASYQREKPLSGAMQIVWSIPKHPRLLIFNWYYCVETRRLTVAKIQSAIS